MICHRDSPAHAGPARPAVPVGAAHASLYAPHMRLATSPSPSSVGSARECGSFIRDSVFPRRRHLPLSLSPAPFQPRVYVICSYRPCNRVVLVNVHGDVDGGLYFVTHTQYSHTIHILGVSTNRR